VNSFGQIVGSAWLVGSERYDVSGCQEAIFRIASGAPGTGLYVSDTGVWQQPRSAQWTPTDGERASLATAVHEVADPLFFRVPASPVDDRLAVVGGRVLAIMRANGAGGWSPVFEAGAWHVRAKSVYGSTA
jgi:hypothetical protein